MSFPAIRLLLDRQFCDDTVQNRESRRAGVRRFHAFHHDASAMDGVPHLPQPKARGPVNTTTGQLDQRFACELVKYLEAAHVGQPQIQHDAIAGLSAA